MVSDRNKRIQIDEKSALDIAQRLTRDTALADGVASGGVDVLIGADPRRGCWVLFDVKMKMLTTPVWDSYQAVAEALLAKLMPTDK